MFRKLSDEELQEWLEKQMEKENRSLENNFFSRVFGRKDDITDEELDRFFADAMERMLQEWLEKQMEKENRSLENNFFSRVFGRKDDITDEELDRFFADAMERIKMQEELQKEEEKKEHLRKEKWKKRFSFKGDSAVGYRKLSKVAGFVIVCAIAVFAASMTIEANSLLLYVRLLFSLQV